MTATMNDMASLLAQVRVRARRMRLQAPPVATVPMLRGVWGAALHDLDPQAYATVFEPQVQAGSESPSQYVLRPAAPDPNFAPAVEWISIGSAIDHDGVLQRAWDIASGMGLGKKRERFHILQVVHLHPDGTPGGAEHWGTDSTAGAAGWSLAEVRWPVPGGPEAPCRLLFQAPLRMLRRKRLIDQPALPDLIVAAGRRVEGFLPPDQRNDWKRLARESLEAARRRPARIWRGDRLDLHRYSARQGAALELHGVAGFLDLPEGPGELWPLLAAAQWLHVGKGAVMGLGQLEIQSLS